MLDLLLPGMSGLEVCRRVRVTSNTPIIVLSVKDSEADKVEALDLGADDYIAKPFGMSELLAPVRVALRRIARAKSGTEPRLQVGPLSVDFAQRRVVLRGREVSLTPIEYELREALHHAPREDSHASDAALAGLGNQCVCQTHSLHVYVAQLRRKIEPDPEQPRLIFTIPGVGYRFTDEEES